MIIAIGCVAIWARLVRRFSLIPVWRAALITLAVAFIPLYFANSLVTAMITSALVGFGFAGVITTMDLINAKIMDEDTRKYNLRREGIISNALGFMNRLNGLFTSTAFYLIFIIFGFESGENPGANPDDVVLALLLLPSLILSQEAVTAQLDPVGESGVSGTDLALPLGHLLQKSGLATGETGSLNRCVVE